MVATRRPPCRERRTSSREGAATKRELTGVAIPIARVAGIALIALGIASWPGPPLVGMLAYSTVVTLYLAYLGFAGGFTGIFLWPAVALHLVLSILLGRAWLATEAR
jgi:hypothetical protein